MAIDLATFAPLIEAYLSARDYDDYTALIQAIRSGDPEVMKDEFIRNWIADRLEGKPVRGRGQNPRSKEGERIAAQIAEHVGKLMALGFAKVAGGNGTSKTAISMTATAFDVHVSTVRDRWNERLSCAVSFAPLFTISSHRALFIANGRNKPPTDEAGIISREYFDATPSESDRQSAMAEALFIWSLGKQPPKRPQ